MTNTNMSTPHQNRNIWKNTMPCKYWRSRLVELQMLLGTYCYGIPMSCLSWLERVYLQKFNKSLDCCKSFGVNNIKQLVEIMRDLGMVLLLEEPESNKVHVMSDRMVKDRQNVSLKPNVQTLLDSNSGVIEFTSFEDLYEQQFQGKLNYFQYGLTNLDHLCQVLNDILMVVEANPPRAKVIEVAKDNTFKKRKYTNMSMLSSPQQNRNICNQIEIKEDQKKAMHSKKDVDVLIDQRLVQLEALLGTYSNGIPMSRLSWLDSGYKQKFKKSLDRRSLGVNNNKELVEKMRCKGMVVFVKGSDEEEHVMTARMVELRQNVFLKLNVQKLLRRHSGEIKFESFEVSYEKQFKVKLNYLWYGLTDLDDLCKVLKDILVVEEANPSRVKVIKAVKNATIQEKGRMTCAPQSVHSSDMTNTNMLTQSSDFYQEIQEVLGDFYLGISLSHWSTFKYRYKLKFNKSLESLGVTDFTQLLRVMGERVVLFVGEWEEEYVMSASVANFRREFCLKPNVEKLLCTHGGEIEFDSFENSYEDQFKDELFYGYYCLTDLDHLCQIFENILVVEEKGKKVIKAVKGMYNLRKKKK
ncbi:hypothetical protein CTI12_AA613340 [Artemisia annua]|uniref:HTH OST-type domain-containing protein n=1 Tax=Artemisia annua TaxID=35608 RepID=A0A2U1KE56_ARTAN|nr:hypothetical protein CTI12_AA613340 [Artemisia annua]